jgi:hypothetical protein
VTGPLQPSVLGELLAFGQRIGEREGPLDVIVDFSGVSDIHLPVNYIAERGEKPPLWPNHDRILVAPQPVLNALMRLYAGYQALHGMRKPIVVGKLEEAFGRFNTSVDEFRPIDGDPPAETLFGATTALV